MTKLDARLDLITQANLAGLPQCECEFMFAPVVDGKHIRRWRADIAYPEQMVAVEIDGGMYTGGRHGGGPQVDKDLEKHAAYAALGWRVVRVTPSLIRKGIAIRWLRAVLSGAPFPF